MNVKELKEMITLMQENGLTELELEKNGMKIRLKKGGAGGIAPEVFNAPASSIVRSTAPPEIPGKGPIEEEGVTVVRSPMVGTFYVAPAPDVAPYVSQGKEVKEGDVICIIEAMKLMNEIKAEISGRISDILVKNGQPVEFDQPLFKIQTT
jgi:acetyl-CoA carboxylase biotin carboxyl carrier protein